MIFQLQPNHVRAFGTPEEVQALYEELVYDLGEKRGQVQRLCLYNPIARVAEFREGGSHRRKS